MTVTEEDGRIIIEPVVPEVRLVRKDGRLVGVIDGPLTPLTTDDVRDALDRARARH